MNIILYCEMLLNSIQCDPRMLWYRKKEKKQKRTLRLMAVFLFSVYQAVPATLSSDGLHFRFGFSHTVH